MPSLYTLLIGSKVEERADKIKLFITIPFFQREQGYGNLAIKVRRQMFLISFHNHGRFHTGG